RRALFGAGDAADAPAAWGLPGTPSTDRRTVALDATHPFRLHRPAAGRGVRLPRRLRPSSGVADDARVATRPHRGADPRRHGSRGGAKDGWPVDDHPLAVHRARAAAAVVV